MTAPLMKRVSIEVSSTEVKSLYDVLSRAAARAADQRRLPAEVRDAYRIAERLDEALRGVK